MKHNTVQVTIFPVMTRYDKTIRWLNRKISEITEFKQCIFTIIYRDYWMWNTKTVIKTTSGKQKLPVRLFSSMESVNKFWLRDSVLCRSYTQRLYSLITKMEYNWLTFIFLKHYMRNIHPFRNIENKDIIKKIKTLLLLSLL